MKELEFFSEFFTRIHFGNPSLFRVSKDRKQFIFRGIYNGSDSLLKMYNKSDIDKAKNILREYQLTKLIEDSAKQNNLDLKIIRVLDKGEFEDYMWVIREFVDGEPLGAMDPDEALGIDCYCSLNEKLFRSKEILADKIIDQIQILGKIKIDEIDKKELNQRFNFDQSDIVNLEKMLSYFDIKSLGYDLSDLLASQSETISIKDLTPSNILIAKNQEVYFFDFEWLGLDNRLFDVSFLWLFLWRDQKLSDDLKKLSIINLEDEKLFNKNIIRIVYFYLKPAILNNEMGKYRSHVWTKYLADSVRFLQNV
ncbi:MAG: hypothetical protein WCG99_01015 [Candidatus Berkelbacteria bacterium]